MTFSKEAPFYEFFEGGTFLRSMRSHQRPNVLKKQVGSFRRQYDWHFVLQYLIPEHKIPLGQKLVAASC